MRIIDYFYGFMILGLFGALAYSNSTNLATHHQILDLIEGNMDVIYQNRLSIEANHERSQALYEATMMLAELQDSDRAVVVELHRGELE